MAGAALGAVGASVIVWVRLLILEMELEPGMVKTGFQTGSQILVIAALLLLPAGMLSISFGRKDWRTFLKLYVMLYFETFLAGGILEAAYQQMESRNIPFWAVFFLVLGTFFLTRFFCLFYQDVKQEQKHCYPVILTDSGTKVTATGYLDTGNQLARPEDQAPVHVVSETVWKQLMGGKNPENKQTISFSTIGNPYGQMEITQIEEMLLQLEHGRKKVLEKPWIARALFPISQGNRYQILLHGETDPESTMSQKNDYETLKNAG